MRGHGEKFSRKKDRLIEGLLLKGSIIQAAKYAGVAEYTARRWMKEPEFEASYREARRASLDRAIDLLHGYAVAAALTLIRNFKAESEAVQVRAATAILERIQAMDTSELTERLEAVEALLETQPARRWGA
jgi:hypothetical protein